jgi:hypothetical protein
MYEADPLCRYTRVFVGLAPRDLGNNEYNFILQEKGQENHEEPAVTNLQSINPIFSPLDK